MTGPSVSERCNQPSPSSQTTGHYYPSSGSISDARPQAQEEQVSEAFQYHQQLQQQEPSQQFFSSSFQDPLSTSAVNSCVNVTNISSEDMLLRVITLNCWYVLHVKVKDYSQRREKVTQVHVARR